MHAGRSYKNPALAVVSTLAASALRLLQRERLVDPARRIRSLGENVVVPVLDAEAAARVAAELGAGEVVEDEAPLPRTPPRTPYEEALDRLEGRLPPSLLPRVPGRWEKLGDVVVLRLPDELAPHARVVAEAFAHALRARAVVRDASGVSGELRTMRGELLWGDDPETTHVEGGVKYRLDASRVMFSSGNVEERQRAGRIPAEGEVVVDMFAGIGYFTLPLAVRARPLKVHALEKNPVSFRYLVENARLNGVEGIVEPWLGDNRDFPLEGVADRVLLGYFPGTAAFLPKAMRLLKPEGGVLHHHDVASAESWRAQMTRDLEDAARDAGRAIEVLEARVVKNYAPGIVHAVVVARAEPLAR